NPEHAEVKAVWQEFELHRSVKRRLPRCLLFSLIYFLLFGLLWVLFAHPMVQARGWLAQVASFAILLLSGGTLIFLLAIVVDSTLIGNRLVTYLSRKAEKWPEKLMTEQAQERGFPFTANNSLDQETEEVIGYWLKIRFVNETTLAVARLIYRPFV